MTKPPQTLTEPMEVDPSVYDAAEMNFLLTSLVVPRAIGWISSISEAGICNLAPFSFFTVASTDPPHLVFSVATKTKDSVVNAGGTGEFVANITDLSLLDEVVGSSAEVAPDRDEFELVGLEKMPSRRVKPPRVARAKAHFECEVRQLVSVGSSTLVIGQVVHMHINPGIWSDGRVRAELLNPVARLGGSMYATLGEMVSRKAPTISERG